MVKEEAGGKSSNDKSISRRKFLKRIAGGGAALGAATVIPAASGFEINSDDPLSYNENFSVDPQGNLDLGGKNIEAVEALSSNSVNGVREVTPENTTDLGSKLGGLIGSESEIFVSPGTYHWTSSQTWNPAVSGRVDIRISSGAEILVSDPNPLTLDSEGDVGSQINGDRITVVGGKWSQDGIDAEVMIEFVDIFSPTFRGEVQGWTNSSSTDAVVLKQKNIDSWSENADFRGYFMDVDIGVQTDISQVNNGTTSFQDSTYAVDMNGVNSIGYDLNGDLASSTIQETEVFLYGSNAIAYHLNTTTFRGGVILSPECEDFSDNDSGVMFKTGSDYGSNPPIVVGLDRIGASLIERSSSDDVLWTQETEPLRIKWEDLGNVGISLHRNGSFRTYSAGGGSGFRVDEAGTVWDFKQFKSGSPVDFADGISIDNDSSVDLSTLSPSENDIRVSNGTNMTAGPAWFDGTKWHSLIDSSTFTP